MSMKLPVTNMESLDNISRIASLESSAADDESSPSGQRPAQIGHTRRGTKLEAEEVLAVLQLFALP